MITPSLLETVTKPVPVDWRYPDAYGISGRTLDCFQLAVHEVLKWKGETEPIRIFLNPFDCTSEGLKLRRRKPELEMGWGASIFPLSDPGSVRDRLCETFREEGYCLLYYEAFEAEFLTYWRKHRIEHWSLVVHCDEDGVTLVDEAGVPALFRGHIGKVPWETLQSSMRRMTAYGYATLRHDGRSPDWDASFSRTVSRSTERMIAEGGLDHLARFIGEVARTPRDMLVGELERLEFDIHYYRRLRELWQLAVERSVVPERFLQPEWAEELFYICKCWSLILGVVMKWKRQPDRDYLDKLVHYMEQTLRNERRMFAEMAKLTGG